MEVNKLNVMEHARACLWQGIFFQNLYLGRWIHSEQSRFD